MMRDIRPPTDPAQHVYMPIPAFVSVIAALVHKYLRKLWFQDCLRQNRFVHRPGYPQRCLSYHTLLQRGAYRVTDVRRRGFHGPNTKERGCRRRLAKKAI